MARQSSRDNIRKSSIKKFLTLLELPVLLDELRWHVYMDETLGRNTSADIIAESYMKSFNRTIRNHYPGIKAFKLHRPELLPSGIVTRAGIYRIVDLSDLNEFRLAKTRTVIACVEKWVNEKNPKVFNTMVQCMFLIQDGKEIKHLSSVNIPLNQPLTIISDTIPSEETIISLARRADWTIRRNIVNDRPGISFDINRLKILSPMSPVTLFSVGAIKIT